MKKTLFSLALSLAAQISIAQSWELLTPMNSGDIVRNCSFLDEQNGYCVLQDEGTVLKSTDGGLSWSRPWTPGISTNLYDVEMVSMDTIFTAGVTGEIFRSTDEGESFQEMTTPTSEWLYALEFIDSSVGFASGFNGVILKTTDGGTTWELKETGTTSRLFDVEFVDETTGYACGWNGTVLKTTDAGETWESLNTDYTGALFNCTFPSALVGYACGFSQTILKTTDGGDTWQVQNDGSINTLNYIEFKDELNGWAGGDFGYFFTTSNGGATWNESQPFGGAAIWSGQYVSDNAAFLMGTGTMLKSENGASSWELIKNAVPNSTYNGLYFQSDDVGHAAGSVGAFAEGTNQSGIVYTENGGQTWELQAQGFSGGWQDIHFSDANNGTVIGGINFGKTSNGGDTWNFSTVPFDITGRCSWFFNSQEGVIGGLGVFDSVCKTTNGGSSYTCQDNTLATDFYFLDELNGWAVGEASSENVLHTTDGGNTWEYVPTGNFQNKFSVFFLDENHGWIGCANGTVIRTTDGGVTWNTSNAGWNTVGVRFYTEQIGFCADNQGYVWRSEDGGANWELFLSGDDPTMSVIEEAYFTENNVYISGWSGDIYKAELGCTDIAQAQILSEDEWCSGDQNTIGFSSTTPVVDFEWTFPEGWTAVENFNSVNLTAGENSGEIQLTTFNSCGLSAITQLSVEVLPQVEEISAVQYTTNPCSNEQFVIDIQDVQDGVNYNWSFPLDWVIQSAGASAVIQSAASSGQIEITGENSCGSSGSFLEMVTVSTAPEITFTAPENLCDNQILQLMAEPAGGTFSGEGVSGDIFEPLTVNGSASVITYSVTSEDNCTAELSQAVAITPSAVTGGAWTKFEYDLCAPSMLIYELDNIDNHLSWEISYPDEWGTITEFAVDFPAGIIDDISTSGDVVITYANECGVSEEFARTVQLLETPSTPVISSYTEEWCSEGEGELVVNLNSADSLVIAESTLNFSIASENNLITLALNGSIGENSISILAENECGTSSDTTILVEILELPEIEFSLPGDTLCAYQEYPFSTVPTGGVLDGIGQSNGVFQTFFLDLFETYDFTYTYTDEFGCINSDSLSVYLDECLSVDELSELNLTIYPNPVSDILTIENESNQPISFSLQDALGREVMSGLINGKQHQLDVSSLASGQYVLKTQKGSMKVMVER